VATSQLRSKRRRLEGKIQRLRMQHTEAIRDKSAADNKSWNLLDMVVALEKENEDLGHRLNDEKDATAEAKTETKTAHAEAQAARKHTTELELEVKGMCAYHKRVEAATQVGVDRAHTLFVVAYRDLGA
jgi:chromosome segregation ATPase